MLWLLAVKKKKLQHLHQHQQLKLLQQHQLHQQLMLSQLTLLLQHQQLTLSQLTQHQQNNLLIIGKSRPMVGFFYACALCFPWRSPLYTLCCRSCCSARPSLR